MEILWVDPIQPGEHYKAESFLWLVAEGEVRDIQTRDSMCHCQFQR